MNLQEIKTQLDALNKAVTEMETAKAEFTFTREQMQRFVAHIASTMVEALNSQIDNEFELDEDSIEVDVSSNYNRSFDINLEIDQREIKRNIKSMIESSYDDNGIMEEVDNCYLAIVEPVGTEFTTETTQD
jgi:ATP-dependent protease HslVU (ClpYQ) ATPase subunit